MLNFTWKTDIALIPSQFVWYGFFTMEFPHQHSFITFRLKIRTTLQIKPSVRKSTIERRRSPTVFIWLITKKGSPIKVNFTHRLINIHNSILLILESKLCIFFRSETSDAWCDQGQTVSSCKTSLAEFETLHCTLGKEEILIAMSHLSETEVFKNTLGVHF